MKHNKIIYLLDTNIISEMMKPNPNQNVLNRLQKFSENCAISSTTLMELLYGVKSMKAGKKRDAMFGFIIDKIQLMFKIIEYDTNAAWIHSDLISRCKENGTPVNFQDSQIASIAISNSLIVVTRNFKDYLPMQRASANLYLENWFE